MSPTLNISNPIFQNFSLHNSSVFEYIQKILTQYQLDSVSLTHTERNNDLTALFDDANPYNMRLTEDLSNDSFENQLACRDNKALLLAYVVRMKKTLDNIIIYENACNVIKYFFSAVAWQTAACFSLNKTWRLYLFEGCMSMIAGNIVNILIRACSSNDILMSTKILNCNRLVIHTLEVIGDGLWQPTTNLGYSAGPIYHWFTLPLAYYLQTITLMGVQRQFFFIKPI